ncbi:toll/interleukin-1 receptor domain-containing protein [Micromonospora sp. DT81.3]|uniref:toll/interleukin-1 receptor domain-containing protein n=1 Tax=Micromonospora sp. DT81.3 TaxID=3416523 RepID=UPI003CE76A19
MKVVGRKMSRAALLTAAVFGVGVLTAMVAISSLGPALEVLGVVIPAASTLFAAAVGYYFGSSRDNREEKLERRQVFIVHAAADVEKARLLARAVENAGYTPWLDVERLAPGDLLTHEISKAIRESGIALFIPPTGPTSESIEHELKALALEVTPIDRRTSPVVPVVDSATDRAKVPAWLSDVAPLSLDDPDWHTKLASTLDGVFKSPSVP